MRLIDTKKRLMHRRRTQSWLELMVYISICLIALDYKARVSANKKFRFEVEDLKTQVQEAETILTSI